ncbi:hypothetical protein SteCoe_14163 [Stentor coeruleus]|uniref:Uncharacterized protein n=1 Tax=Stentor coeruleus TaxID=5963 RepID=A0A1R2C6L0_9CILI|nr:hypothetical protein SteCoe_14163 [Stentor coeruleus]
MKNTIQAPPPFKSLKAKTPNSFILQKSSEYQGPLASKPQLFFNVFSTFRIDPLYCYSTLTYASTKTVNNHAIIPSSEFSYPEYYDLTEAINEICSQSPFKTLEHTSPEVTYSSVNTIEFGLDRCESEAKKLTESKKQLVKQVLREIGKTHEFESSEFSVNLDISESVYFDTSSVYSKVPNSYASVSSKSIFSVTDTHHTMIPTNEEELITCSKESYIVELVPENTFEINNIRHSTDISGIDEGSVHISTRLFLPKACASKNILTSTPKEINIFDDFPVFVKDISLMLPDIPNVLSPIYRKIVFCASVSNPRNLEIKNAVTCTGFIACPIIEFSNLESHSRGIIQYRENKVIRLISERIAFDMLTRQVSWMSFGFEHCCLLTTEGEVYSWGYGASGCLGQGHLLSCTFPTLISHLPKSTYIESGAYHTVAITESEEIYVWGRGDVNQLGIPEKNLQKDHLGCFTSLPTKIELFGSKKIKGTACGEAHTLVIDNEGALYSFGWAEDGQLGLPNNWIKDKYMSFSPRRVIYLKHKKVVKASAGAIFSLALTDSGEIYIWGNGELGQLGLGNTVKKMEFPSIVTSLEKEIIVDAVCGEAHVICVSKAGTLYGWGQGLAGIFEMRGNQFPYGSDVVCNLPRRLAELDISHRIRI